MWRAISVGTVLALSSCATESIKMKRVEPWMGWDLYDPEITWRAYFEY